MVEILEEGLSEFYDKILRIEKESGVYVIAEVGSNYRTEQDLTNAIGMAKACGADAVKFQYFDESELFGPVAHIRKDNPLPRLKAKADAVMIDLICSSFSPEGMKEIDPYVCAHKIASSEMSHIRMLEMARKLAKPVIISTGAYHMIDIKRMVEFMFVEGKNLLPDPEIILLHCNVSYPAKYTDIQKFAEIKMLGPPVGFSDHTTSIDVVPCFYKGVGACVYEKHFNPFGLADTPDAPHSLDVDEFKTMVSYLRGIPKPYSEEGEARLKHIRRVVATQDIKHGETLQEGVNMGIFRSRTEDINGLNPFQISRLEGKKAMSDIKAGQGLSLLNVQ